MSHGAEPWVVMEGEPLLGGIVAVCLKEGGNGGHKPGKGRHLRPWAWLCWVRLSSCLRAWHPGPVEASWVAEPSPFPQALANWTCTATWEGNRELGLPGF